MPTTTTSLPTVTLKAKRDQSIRRKHPWIFSGGVKHIQGDPQAGDLVKVCANKGRTLGWGHYAPNASIAVRMLSFDESSPDDSWWYSQIAQAVAVRRDLNLFQSNGQNACRLVHAEGDGLPGLIADLYNGILVIQCHTPGMPVSYTHLRAHETS